MFEPINYILNRIAKWDQAVKLSRGTNYTNEKIQSTIIHQAKESGRKKKIMKNILRPFLHLYSNMLSTRVEQKIRVMNMLFSFQIAIEYQIFVSAIPFEVPPKTCSHEEIGA